MSLGQNDNALLKLLADEALHKYVGNSLELEDKVAALAAENERLRRDADAFFNLWLAAKERNSL